MAHDDLIRRAAIFLLRYGRLNNGWNLERLATANAHEQQFVVTLALLMARQEFATADAPFRPDDLRRVCTEIGRDIRAGKLTN